MFSENDPRPIYDDGDSNPAREVACGAGGGDAPGSTSEGATAMRSEKQREASRANGANGAKSKGPTTPTGKNKSKFNGLKDGLRSNQIVLPGESAAEFQAELKGWADDWRPGTHTRAVLVERAAVASWRLRRCVRAESDLLMDLAARANEVRDRVDRAEDLLFEDAAAAVAELRSMPAGVDALTWRWKRLETDLDDGPEAWDEQQHSFLLNLLGLDDDADPAGFGPLAADSRRLALDNKLREDDDEDPALMPRAEVAGTESRIRRGIGRELAALREHRRGLVAPPGLAAGLKFVNVSPEVMLLHRYEMAHERSLRAAIKDLAALARSGADEVGRDGNKTEVASPTVVTHDTPVGENPAAAAAPSQGLEAGRAARAERTRDGGRPGPLGRYPPRPDGPDTARRRGRGRPFAFLKSESLDYTFDPSEGAAPAVRAGRVNDPSRPGRGADPRPRRTSGSSSFSAAYRIEPLHCLECADLRRTTGSSP
jgi:hypothetical protein